MKYRLYTYDLWGNARDGYEVNDVYPTSTVIDVEENTTDLSINRRIGARGVEWDGEFGYSLYGNSRKHGHPVCELRPV